MLGIKASTLAALIFASSSALADIKIIDTENGAWVTVRDMNGMPQAGAMVKFTNVPQDREVYTTNENGRVFIPITLERSRSIRIEAVSGNGLTKEELAFHHSASD
ncbi:hypothetical protein [Thaumasiovibrio subtropicus]|uniref:hypothetical protein n=1 Tax=Thaumasiovibrio subtropicus TaxID=1891207 RepID=UPI000B35C048|nr:hypothetical protein [Thaumasiovibrio subtropicus]